MSTENEKKDKQPKKTVTVQQGGGDTVYGLGLFGAWAYYIGRASTTEEKIKGFFKGFIWPATLVYELLQFFLKEEAEAE